MTPKILVPERISAEGIALLSTKDFVVDQRSNLSESDLLQIIADYEALVVRSETKVTAELLAAAKLMKVVARAGVGVDNVDVASATKNGIIVINSPAGNINAAAEHTIALMMAVARNVSGASASLRDGKWERSKFVGIETKGKVLGIIGLGKVGLRVARIANGLGMTVVAYDPYANPSLASAASVELRPDLPQLLAEADFLTIHTPLMASTRGMLGKAELARMKPTARVLNVARGGVIDEDALLEALDAGTIAGAGLDVFTSEPPSPGSPALRLTRHPKVVATPHLGASTVEAQENVSIDVCEQVVAILSGELPRSAVNAPIILPEEYRALQPYVLLVEKMGSLYTQYMQSNRSFRTTFDLVYEGALTAGLNSTKPLFAALVKGLLSTIVDTININIVNAELIAKERGILINEHRSRENVEQRPYSSFVTLRARATRSTSHSREWAGPTGQKNLSSEPEQVIQGFVSGETPYISRLNLFKSEFIAAGDLLICRHYDSPGRVGFVGSKLGLAGVNIRFMSVAPLYGEQKENNEALMILGVEGPVDAKVKQSLIAAEGVLEASTVML